MTQQPVISHTRDYHVDNIKGVLIFLVVCGHLISTLQEANSTFAIGIRAFIYFFHMPGFIFMSGYLAKGFLKKQYKGEKLLSYAWLYLLFKDAIDLVHFIFRRPYFEGNSHNMELIFIVLLLCFGIWLLSLLYSRFPKLQPAFILLVTGISLLKVNVFTVGAAPWYLLALVWWHIIVYLTRHMNPKYVMITSILLAAVIGYQDSVGKFLSLSRMINFMPFFLLGFYMPKERFNQIVNHTKGQHILSAIFILSAVLIIPNGRAVQKWLGVFFYGVSPYEKLLKLSDFYYGIAPLTCILWMAVTMLLLFGLFALCPKKQTFLAKAGRNTLGIYVFHRLFKDFLIYGGFYSVLSQNEFVAVAEVLLMSLLLTNIFKADLWSEIITKLSVVNAKRFYKEKYQNSK